MKKRNVDRKIKRSTTKMNMEERRLVVKLSCKHLFLDGGGGRSLAIGRENGLHHTAERNRASSTQPDLQK
jgi:hypothetical protein